MKREKNNEGALDAVGVEAGASVAEFPESPARPGWVDTPSSKRIFAALTCAREYSEIAVIHGGTGVGKTMAAERYGSEFENVWIAGMSQAKNKLRPMLESVMRACGLRYVHGSAYRMENEIVERMRRSYDWLDERSKGLLIIDEAQHLDHPQLEELRSLHDESGCGLALLGNDAFGARIQLPEFAALASRVYARVHLEAATAADVDALLGTWGVGGARARGEALALAAPPGGLRKLTRALERGALAASNAGSPRSVRSSPGGAA